jgi:hypothetical protein
MNLKSFGCSFIFGSELADNTNNNTPSQLTWPALYAGKLEYEYQCHARPGSGNLQIAEQVLNQLADNVPAFYVIGWTWIDRFDYTTQDDQWQTVRPVDDSSLAKTYYRDLHSQYRDKLTTLMNIKLTLDTLRQKQCPFIMTYMDDLIFETEWHAGPAVTELQNYIRPHMTTFEGMSFLEWSRFQGYPETKLWHPLEPAHSAAAEYMLELGINKI